MARGGEECPALNIEVPEGRKKKKHTQLECYGLHGQAIINRSEIYSNALLLDRFK